MASRYSCVAVLTLAVFGGSLASEVVAQQKPNLSDQKNSQDGGLRSMRRLSPESYVDRAAIWSDRWPIPVCWEPSEKPYSEEKKWVEDAIRAIIEKATAVRFAGYDIFDQRWPKCTPGTMGIHILIADKRPRSDVGQQWTGGPNGEEEPTRMTLNFELGGAYSRYCQPRKRHCIEVTSVHEFLHAIGFLHEHLRDDAPNECRQRFSHEEDFHGVEPERISLQYDGTSIMNYCESIFREPVRLSDDDVEAVNYFYKRG